MRPIKRIIVHCTATKEGEYYTVEDVNKWHKLRGFRKVGYHYVIRLDGVIDRGRNIEEIGAHCQGFNSDSIGISYVGGLDKSGKAKDTRTNKQNESLEWLIYHLKSIYPSIEEIKGHRDYSPDLNNDGEITPDEWMKDCPCFEVTKEYKL